MKRRPGAKALALLLATLLPAVGCAGKAKPNIQTVTFPVSDSGKTEFNAAIYEVEPFTLTLELPEGWTLWEQSTDAAEAYPFISVFSRLDILNEKSDPVGVLGYNLYELYEGAEDDPRAIYGQIALGNNYQFDVRESYQAVNETDTGVTAVVDVYYSASINGGAEKRNRGIVCYNRELLAYIAAEFDADKISEEQLSRIAQSVGISREAK